MAQLLNEIQWGEPILPAVMDPAWEAELKRRQGRVGETDKRVAPNPWLREAALNLGGYRPRYISARLANIGTLVTAQENSCRYCYGATRSTMRLLGYSESLIGRIERDAHVADLDDKERAFIQFCRNLARSRPRPVRGDREALIRLGYEPLAVTEMAYLIAVGCFFNRVATFMACPPERAFERFANGYLGRLVGFAAPLARALAALKRPAPEAPAASPLPPDSGPFASIVATLAGLPVAASDLRGALEGAFASPLLPRRVKALMFAVVAQSLDCRHCETEACALLQSEGFTGQEIAAALATLDSPRLEPFETKLLTWVRGTVHYQPSAIQEQTRALVAEIGAEKTLEAIGVAALANATVRLAMLLE